MKFSKLFILFIVIIAGSKLSAQEKLPDVKVIYPVLGKNDTIRVLATNDNGYMVPWFPLREVVIFGVRTFKSVTDQAAYNRLRYNVLKVMPYALYAKKRYEQLERDLAVTIDKKVQKKNG